MAELTIIIPARNEELSIAATIKKLIDKVTVEYEILVVNDHSSDKTKEIILRLSRQYANIRIIDNESCPSFVNAFLCGIRNVKTPFFVAVMADLCDEPETINIMHKKIKEDYDVPNAFKMYRSSVLEGMEIESRGFEVSAEIPLKAYFKGARITEVPTVWRERQAGASHFKMLKTGPGYF